MPTLLSVTKIWDAAEHNAFTDLTRFRGEWFCTFREADAHVPGRNGKIRVIASDDAASWESAALLDEPGVDLRDPKICVTPDDRLMLVIGGSIYAGSENELNRAIRTRQTRIAFSDDGRTWSPLHPILSEPEWLWRVTWHDGAAWGVSRRPVGGLEQLGDRTVERVATLWRSANGVDYEPVPTGGAFEMPGWPNETTLRFDGDEMIALVRRELGDRHARIGSSRPPYEDWTWHDAGSFIGGPNFIVLPGGTMIAGGRHVFDGEPKTAIGPMTREGYSPELVLPSGGDTSYPGFVWHADRLWVSYYSSHEDRTSVYLATIRL